jgi:predicted metalloprotease with PDZ domain
MKERDRDDLQASAREQTVMQPQPSTRVQALPPPRDVEFPGTILLHVDATDQRRGIFQVEELIPVPAPGPMTLLYPKWLPGYHCPNAPISLLAGLEITAGGQLLDWKRDLIEVHAFHIDVPAGVPIIEVRFQFLSPTSSSQGRIVVTPDMLNLQWNAVLLYPAGYYSRRIQVHARVRLPEGFACGSALRGTSLDGRELSFEPTSLDVLIDSPILAGRYHRRIDLDDQGMIGLDLVADRPDLLEATPAQIDAHRALIVQADRLFGARHFDHYDFLVALTDELGAIGVEHHRSCEIGTYADYFVHWERHAPSRDVMAHEYTHSWNGKFRRGADSWTPTFEQPIRNSLMWVYEGQTQYWGNVLSARSGLWTTQQALQSLARTAAIYDNRAGRRWRSMSDTTGDPIITGRAPLPWLSWQRSEDYYSEGQLLWLDVDTLIRELSEDTLSLDTFAAAFFGPRAGSYATWTYEFADIVQQLDDLVHYEWETFLCERLESRQARPPLDGITRGGYRLVYRKTPTEFARLSDGLLNVLCLRFSLGLTISERGVLQEVLWGSPAFQAGLTAASTIIAVNDRAYSHDEIEQAVTAAEQGRPLELLVRNGRRHREVELEYRGGHRYPDLEPVEGSRRRLDEIFAPRTEGPRIVGAGETASRMCATRGRARP